MTQASLGPAGGDLSAPRNDMLTVLIIIATAFVYVAAVFALIRSAQLFGSLLPPAGG